MNGVSLKEPLVRTVSTADSERFHIKHGYCQKTFVSFDRNSSSASLNSNLKRSTRGFASGSTRVHFLCLCSLAQSSDSHTTPLSFAQTDEWKFGGKSKNSTRSCQSNRAGRIENGERKCSSAKLDRFLGSSVSSKCPKQELLIDEGYAVTDRLDEDTVKDMDALRDRQLMRALISLIASGLVFMLPSIEFADNRFSATANSSMASPVNQLKQAGVVLEKLAGGLKNGRVLDKITTVISGQTTVDPEILDKEVKAILDGDQDIVEDLKDEFLNSVKENWYTFIDLTSNFNPSAFSESTGATVQGLLEGAAERFAAWELSTLVALGERWLIITPIVMIPMAWQMSRYRDEQRSISKRQEEAIEQSKEANQRQLKVRRELERIELKASLLQLISSPMKATDSNNQRINQIVQRLQELNPYADLVHANSVSKGSNDSFTYTQQRPDVDGNWLLSYVSQISNEARQSQFPQIPGVEIVNVRQQIWHGSPNAASIGTDEQPVPLKLLARNTAQISLGPLGAVEVAVQGNWEDIKDKQAALVSFNTFSIRPLNLFGAEVRQDLPPVIIPVPNSLQQSAEWKIIYLDDDLRINKGREENLYIFKKID